MLILDKMLVKYHFYVKIEEIFHEIQCNIYAFTIVSPNKYMLIMWKIYVVILRTMLGYMFILPCSIEKANKQRQNPNKQKTDKCKTPKNCLQVSEVANSRLTKRARILEREEGYSGELILHILTVPSGFSNSECSWWLRD